MASAPDPSFLANHRALLLLGRSGPYWAEVGELWVAARAISNLPPQYAGFLDEFAARNIIQDPRHSAIQFDRAHLNYNVAWQQQRTEMRRTGLTWAEDFRSRAEYAEAAARVRRRVADHPGKRVVLGVFDAVADRSAQPFYEERDRMGRNGNGPELQRLIDGEKSPTARLRLFLEGVEGPNFDLAHRLSFFEQAVAGTYGAPDPQPYDGVIPILKVARSLGRIDSDWQEAFVGAMTKKLQFERELGYTADYQMSIAVLDAAKRLSPKDRFITPPESPAPPESPRPTRRDSGRVRRRGGQLNRRGEGGSLQRPFP